MSLEVFVQKIFTEHLYALGAVLCSGITVSNRGSSPSAREADILMGEMDDKQSGGECGVCQTLGSSVEKNKEGAGVLNGRTPVRFIP